MAGAVVVGSVVVTSTPLCRPTGGPGRWSLPRTLGGRASGGRSVRGGAATGVIGSPGGEVGGAERSVRRDERSGWSRGSGPASRTSGACRRTMVRATSAGVRCRVSQRADHHDREGDRHGERRRAAPSSAPPQPGCGPTMAVPSTAALARPPPTASPAERTDVGEPAPPDAEHEQRAERRGRDPEGQPDRGRDADPLGAEGQHIGHQNRCGTTDPEGAHRQPSVAAARPGPARRRPRWSARTRSTGTPRTPRPSPARPAAWPSWPPTRRSGSSSTVASVSPVSSRSGA